MILDKNSQAMKLGVLQKIKDLMDSIDAGALGGKKPDAAIISVKSDEAPLPEELGEKEETGEPDEDDDDLKKLMAEYEARMK